MRSVAVQLFFLLLAADASAARVSLELRVRVPENTPPDATVFVTGSFQDWQPGDPAYALQEDERIEFQFTRGSRETVEAGPQGQRAPRRRLLLTESRSLDLTVATWSDLGLRRTLTGNVSEHRQPEILDGRRFWSYLPPGYDESDRRYPVLYMTDGDGHLTHTRARARSAGSSISPQTRSGTSGQSIRRCAAALTRQSVS